MDDLIPRVMGNGEDLVGRSLAIRRRMMVVIQIVSGPAPSPKIGERVFLHVPARESGR